MRPATHLFTFGCEPNKNLYVWGGSGCPQYFLITLDAWRCTGPGGRADCIHSTQCSNLLKSTLVLGSGSSIQAGVAGGRGGGKVAKCLCALGRVHPLLCFLWGWNWWASTWDVSDDGTQEVEDSSGDWGVRQDGGGGSCRVSIRSKL